MKEQKIIYYDDELNNEFSSAKITPRVIDESYKYIHKNVIWNFCSFCMQNILSVPIKFLYSKIKFRHKYVGKEKLKLCKDKGYFIYANHTQPFADTFLTSRAIYPKRDFLIVNPENVSMKGLGTLVAMLGAIPVPSNKTAMKNFFDKIQDIIKHKYAITIYPEAHIWPYYTGIRNFKSVSFRYPVELKCPTYCMTNTYQKRGKNGKKVRIVSYIDGPFYAPEEGTLKERKEALRNMVYEKMCERAKNSNIDVIKYVKKDSE